MVKKRKRSKNEGLDNKNTIFIFVRYVVLLVLGFSIFIIYKIFTPLTIYLSFLLLKLFFQVGINGNILVINTKTFIEIIPACVGGSAYLLLIILNLTVPMNLKKRLYSLIFSMVSFLFLNVLRIFLLILIYQNDFSIFDITHKIFWYVLSTIFVVVIWFVSIKIFSIKELPVYSDFKRLMSDIRKK